MKILVACEFSGIVRDAFCRLGHDAWSNDLETVEAEGEYVGNHLYGDCFDMIDSYGPFDLLIAHPPCTHLAVSGARWFKDKIQEQQEAIEFVERLWLRAVKRICIENPISVLSTKSTLGKPTQIIQPWQFGHGETKATCLWLKNLPPLVPTNIVEGRQARVHREPPHPDRWKNRSRTYAGIAKAIAEQWGSL